MLVHSATCSYSVELNKQWYTLADFLPNWDISRGFHYIITNAVRISEAAMGGAGDIIFIILTPNGSKKAWPPRKTPQNDGYVNIINMHACV
jgi:hypothetical protein